MVAAVPRCQKHVARLPAAARLPGWVGRQRPCRSEEHVAFDGPLSGRCQTSERRNVCRNSSRLGARSFDQLTAQMVGGAAVMLPERVIRQAKS